MTRSLYPYLLVSLGLHLLVLLALLVLRGPQLTEAPPVQSPFSLMP